jgi:glutathione S-transferase
MKAWLFQFNTSPFCAKVRKILDYKGVEYEALEVDYLERAALAATTGQVTVPAIKFDSGETITDSDRIAARLEELFPTPTIFPQGQRATHLALARYFDTEMEEAVLRFTLPDSAAHFRRQGEDRFLVWKLMREKKYGEGFYDRMLRERDANYGRISVLLKPFDEQLSDRAFITGRIGLADFSFYGVLRRLTFTGKNNIPESMKRLRAYFDRIERISAAPEPPPA